MAEVPSVWRNGETESRQTHLGFGGRRRGFQGSVPPHIPFSLILTEGTQVARMEWVWGLKRGGLLYYLAQPHNCIFCTSYTGSNATL